MVSALKESIRRRSYLRAPYSRAAFHWHARALAKVWRNLPERPAAKAQPEIFIFGRYGTETVGNFFIQVGLLRVLHKALPDRSVHLLSRDPDFTRAGIAQVQELLTRQSGFVGLREYIRSHVFVAGEERIRSMGPGDLLMLGGGPLTDDPTIVKWLLWFQWARRAGARTMIAGCGLGPLRNATAVSLVKSLLATSDAALVRNRPSAEFERAAACRPQLVLDPAFLCHSFLGPLVGSKDPLLAINARALDYTCSPDREITPAEVAESVVVHTLPLAGWGKVSAIVPFSTQERDVVPDSAVSARAAEALAKRLGIAAVPRSPATVTDVVDALSKAEYLVSTRMHGFILGLMLGCRAAHLDYISGGGKGDQLYREWIRRQGAPSLFERAGLPPDEYLSLSSLTPLKTAIDGLEDTYTSAVRQACL